MRGPSQKARCSNSLCLTTPGRALICRDRESWGLVESWDGGWGGEDGVGGGGRREGRWGADTLGDYRLITGAGHAVEGGLGLGWDEGGEGVAGIS